MIQPFLHLERSAKLNPTATAISSPEVNLTYSELLDSSIRFARVFREAGIKPGDVVGVNIPSFLDLVITQALFHEACIGSQLPMGHIDVINKYFDWVVVDRAIEGFPESRQIIVDEQFMQRMGIVVATANPLRYESEQSVCRLNFSSGTTGKPKAIPVSIECLEDRSLIRTKQWMPLEPYLCLLGLSTGLTFMSYYFHIAAGKTFILAGNPQQAASQINEHSVSCIMGSPHQLNQLLQHVSKNQKLDSLQIVMSAGSVMPDSLTKHFQDSMGVRVVATYASSEAGSTAIREGLGSFESFAGNLLDDVEVKILDDAGAELPDGQIGKIAIKRAKQPTEYFRDSEATRVGYLNGYYLPGDLGFLEGRKLFLSGRSAEVFNVGGLKVDPAWLEAVVLEYDAISEAAICSVDIENGLISIGLVLTSAEPVDLASLFAFLADRVPGEFIPKQIARAPNIPRNHMGKINRAELAKLYFNQTSNRETL